MDAMEEKELIKARLEELLEKYYKGSFVQLVCEYIRISGMPAKEVVEVLEEMKKEKEG